MKAGSRWLTPLLAAVALGLLAIALVEFRFSRAGERAATAERERRDDLRQKFQRAEARLAKLEQAAAHAGAPQGKAESVAREGKPRSVGETTMVANLAAGDPRLLTATDPKLRALYVAAFRAEIDGTWGPLLARLNLSPDQVEKFKALVLRHEERRLDVTAVAAEKKLSLGDPAIQKTRSDDGAIRVKEMRELLGSENMKAYNQYNHDLVLQPIVADLVERTYLTAAPLTLAQSQQLMTILSANSEKRPNNFVRENTVKWDQAIAQAEASGAFSSETLDALRRYAAQRAVGEQVGKKWNEIGGRVLGIGGKDHVTIDVENVWLPGVSFMKGGN